MEGVDDETGIGPPSHPLERCRRSGDGIDSSNYRILFYEVMMSPHFREALSMEPEPAGRVKYGVWGLILGAVIAIVTGFAWGGWRTGGASQRMTDEALLGTRGAICGAPSVQAP